MKTETFALLPDNVFARYFVAYAVSIFVITEPIHPVLATLWLLVFVDTIFGTWAAKKRKDQIEISSGGRRALVKVFVYTSLTVTTFFMEKYITSSWLYLLKGITMACALVEIASILENAGIILDKPVFKFIIDKIHARSGKFEVKPTTNKKEKEQ